MLFVILDLSIASARDTPNYCCNEGAYIKRNGCTDGKNLTVTCKVKYLVSNDEDDGGGFSVDGDQLYLGSQTIPPDE